MADDGTFRYAVGPVITWPALNLGRIKARVDQSSAREREARAQYDATVLRAMQDVETSLVRYRTAQGRMDRLRDAADASARAASWQDCALPVESPTSCRCSMPSGLSSRRRISWRRAGPTRRLYAVLYKALGGSWPAPVAKRNSKTATQHRLYWALGTSSTVMVSDSLVSNSDASTFLLDESAGITISPVPTVPANTPGVDAHLARPASLPALDLASRLFIELSMPYPYGSGFGIHKGL